MSKPTCFHHLWSVDVYSLNLYSIRNISASQLAAPQASVKPRFKLGFWFFHFRTFSSGQVRKDSFFKDWETHESQWHKSMDTHFIETWYKNKSYIKFCLLVVASDPKWQKKEIKGRKKGSLATHPWCVELQWCSLSGSKPDPWCCRGAAVFQSPILGVIHVFANMSWWGFRRGREEQLNRVGGC